MKKYYQMELALESGDKTQLVRIPNPKDDLTLAEVQGAMNQALAKKMFMKNGVVATTLKNVYVTETKALQ